MRAIENVSGRRRLLPIYHRWRTTGDEPAHDGGAARAARHPARSAGAGLARHGAAADPAGAHRQPSVRHRRRHRAAGAGRAARPSLPGSHQQRFHEAAGDQAACAADRLLADPGGGRDQSQEPDRGAAPVAGGRHHRGVPGRRGRHRGRARRQGRGAALEGIHGPADPAGAGGGAAGLFRGPEQRALSPGQPLQPDAAAVALGVRVPALRGRDHPGACGGRGAVRWARLPGRPRRADRRALRPGASFGARCGGAGAASTSRRAPASARRRYPWDPPRMQ